MNISMNQAELEEAVRAHIAMTGLNCDINSITFTATRGDAGIVTEVELTSCKPKVNSESAPVAKISPQKVVPHVVPKPALIDDVINAPDAVEDVEDVLGEVIASVAPKAAPGKSLFK